MLYHGFDWLYSRIHLLFIMLKLFSDVEENLHFHIRCHWKWRDFIFFFFVECLNGWYWKLLSGVLCFLLLGRLCQLVEYLVKWCTTLHSGMYKMHYDVLLLFCRVGRYCSRLLLMIFSIFTWEVENWWDIIVSFKFFLDQVGHINWFY